MCVCMHVTACACVRGSACVCVYAWVCANIGGWVIIAGWLLGGGGGEDLISVVWAGRDGRCT